MRKIRSDEEFVEIQETGRGFVYNDFSGRGASGEEYNILHAASCRWLKQSNTNVPKIMFEKIDEAIDWLVSNRGQENSYWRRCTSCLPTGEPNPGKPVSKKKEPEKPVRKRKPDDTIFIRDITFDLYSKDQVLKKLDGFEPLLAQWEKSTHPAQIRLNSYLEWLTEALMPLPSLPGGLFLHLEVDVGSPAHLLQHHDLENYVTPLFGRKWLDHKEFVLVTAEKKVGGGSSLEVGSVRKIDNNTFDSDWGRFTCSPQMPPSSKEWKKVLHDSLMSKEPVTLQPGPVEVQLAWKCAPYRNWVHFWKPTGDVMGPVLGYASSTNIFHPNDDRIASLKMHKNVDSTLGHNVDVGMWWRKGKD